MAKHEKQLKSLADLEPHDCRWPIGDPRDEDFHFCGAEKKTDRPYCEHHWKMSFTPSKFGQRSKVAVPPIKQAA